jgi:hypothetical protein
MNPQVFSFADSVCDLEEFAREANISAADRSIRGTIRRAYREVVAIHNWTCLQTTGRILLQAAISDGSITYDHTGGTYERQLTLMGETWPTDAEDWSVQLETDDGFLLCDIESRKSDTVVTLESVMNPRRDLAAGTSYAAYPRFYRLPNDFATLGQPIDESFSILGQYITPQHMLELSGQGLSADNIRYYTIASVSDLYGSMGIILDSYFTAVKTISFSYRRKPRELRYAGKDTAESPGTITIGTGSASISGTTTAFNANHVGSLLRIGTSTSKLPTGLDGLFPYVEQRVITAYTSPTAVTLDAKVAAAASGVKYAITDPIDLDPIVYDAMLALAKKYLAAEKNAPNWRQIAQAAEETIFRAKCADGRVTERRFLGQQPSHSQRLADTPRSWRTEIP